MCPLSYDLGVTIDLLTRKAIAQGFPFHFFSLTLGSQKTWELTRFEEVDMEALGGVSGLKEEFPERKPGIPLQLRRVQSSPDAIHCPSGLWVLPMFCGAASGAAPQRPCFLSLAQMLSAGREPSPAGRLLGIS